MHNSGIMPASLSLVFLKIRSSLSNLKYAENEGDCGGLLGYLALASRPSFWPVKWSSITLPSAHSLVTRFEFDALRAGNCRGRPCKTNRQDLAFFLSPLHVKYYLELEKHAHVSHMTAAFGLHHFLPCRFIKALQPVFFSSSLISSYFR